MKVQASRFEMVLTVICYNDKCIRQAGLYKVILELQHSFLAVVRIIKPSVNQYLFATYEPSSQSEQKHLCTLHEPRFNI